MKVHNAHIYLDNKSAISISIYIGIKKSSLLLAFLSLSIPHDTHRLKEKQQGIARTHIIYSVYITKQANQFRKMNQNSYHLQQRYYNMCRLQTKSSSRLLIPNAVPTSPTL